MHNFQPVNRAKPCPKCGRSHGCRIGELPGNMVTILCKRVTSGARKIASNGDGVYVEPNNGMISKYVLESKHTTAPINRRDSVYRSMLGRLGLDSFGRSDLRRRGLSDSEIELLGYKTCADVAQRLVYDGYILDAIPGFYVDNGLWTTNLVAGYFVPVLDAQGRIQGLQIKTQRGRPKYLWLSSHRKFDFKTEQYVNLEGGGFCGSPLHHRSGEGDVLWITESPLKADILWLKTKLPVVGAAGTKASHSEIAEHAKNYRAAVVAYDGDWRANQNVKHDISTLARSVNTTTGIMPSIAVWPSEVGIDDAMQAGLAIDVVSFKDWTRLSTGRFAAAGVK